MALKPPALCKLEKDKLIDTQNNFVDTFNWVVASINNLQGGQGCDVNWTAPDCPTINVYEQDTSFGYSGGGSGDLSSGVIFTGTDGTQTEKSTEFTFDGDLSVSCNGTNISIKSLSSETEVDAVFDIQESATTNGKKLTIEYTDTTTPDKEISIPYKSKFNGTSGSTNYANQFSFASGLSSNVKIEASGTSIKIGVYYL